MSWGTDFTANVFIKNKLIKTKADAESELDYAQSEKQKIRERLIAMSALTPSGESDELIINSILTEIRDLLEWYDGVAELETKLRLFINSLE